MTIQIDRCDAMQAAFTLRKEAKSTRKASASPIVPSSARLVMQDHATQLERAADALDPIVSTCECQGRRHHCLCQGETL